MLTIRTIVQDLAADFGARNIGATVVFGNWQVEQHKGGDRVVIGLGDFDPDAQGLAPLSGPGHFPHPGGSTAAPTLALHLQEGIVWVHGVAPEGTSDEERINAAHDRTTRLLHATIAGLRRVVGFGALIFGKGQWPAVDTADVTYGALCRFRFSVAVPVLGDPLGVLPKPYAAQTTVSMNLPGGPVVGATFPTEGPA